MKATFKSIAVALAVLIVIVSVLAAVDAKSNVSAAVSNTFIKVVVMDLDGTPLHNAKVTVGNASFFTDNKGSSPSIELSKISNSYDASVTDWGTVTVVVERDGFAPTFVFNCVVYRGQTRKLTVKAYPKDGTSLPYVSYVESPPDEYIKGLLSEK